MGKILDILLPWQLKYFHSFQDKSRLITMCSRQIGKSFIGAFCAVYDVILNGGTWTIVSTGQRAADEIFKKCVRITRYFEGMLRGTKLHFEYDSTASEIRFSNGGLITSCPNNPDGLRGRTSSLLFDEMAFIDNATECWSACIPFLTSPFGATKKLQIFSTPAGCSGMFYDLWNKSDFIHTKVTLLDAVNEGLNVNVDELRKTVVDDDIWRQEYLCEFLDSNTSLFPYDLLRECIYLSIPKQGKKYLGVDIGRTHDRTSIAFLTEADGILYLDHVESLDNRDFAYQQRYLENIIKSSNPVKVCIDSTGIGAQLGETLHKEFPSKVKEIKFTNEIKNTMFNETKIRLGNKTLLIPNINSVLDDLHKIRRLVSPSGNLSYGASRDDSGHADDATAIALGVYAAMKPKSISFIPITL